MVFVTIAFYLLYTLFLMSSLYPNTAKGYNFSNYNKIKGLSHDSPYTLYKNIMNLFSEQDSL